MTFEFDDQKNQANIKNHGIDFLESQKLWKNPHIIIPAKNVKGENRFAILGKIGAKIYMAIYTERTADRIRLISCHRVSKKWEEYYEIEIQKKEGD